MRKKKTHSNSEIQKIYHDFTIYKDLKNLQKNNNPYSMPRLSSTAKKNRVSSFFSNPTQNPIDPPKIKVKVSPPRKKKLPEFISEAKSQEIAERIENQIREDVRHFSQIGETALFGFREKVSLYNSFFTRYLFDNHREFGYGDLVLQPFSLFTAPEKNYEEESDLSPQEKIRRQKPRGSVFPMKSSMNMSPFSPKNLNKNTKTYENFKGRYLMNQSPSTYINKKYGGVKNTNTMNEIFPKSEKKDIKKNWEYLYHLSQSDLLESQQKLNSLKKNLEIQEKKYTPQESEFLKDVKENNVEKVKITLIGQKIKERDIPNPQKLINTVDSYVYFLSIILRIVF